MPRKPKAPPPTAPQGSYAQWREHAAAVLERRGISPGVMREREWRRLFIAGVTPEEAAARAETGRLMPVPKAVAQRLNEWC